MSQDKKPPHIIQQHLALDTYLSTLLETVPEATLDSQEEPVAAVAVNTRIALATKPALDATTPLIETPFKPPVEVVMPTKVHPLSVMPAWAQQEFQALFFKVEHLILATPLTELSKTLKIERKPGKIPGQPSWFLGLLDDQESRVGVLDMGQLIFGKSRGGQRDLDSNPFKSILITSDKRWGLACDEILSIGRLKPDKVRWRTYRQKRPWLIGTVIEELTTIVDLQALVPHRRENN